MKEFVISEAQTEKAALVGLITQTQNERKTNEYLDELAFWPKQPEQRWLNVLLRNWILPIP